MAVHGRDVRPARLLLGLAVNGAVPVVAYAALRVPLHSDIAALAIGSAAPIGWSLAFAAWRRRVDPIALIALAGLGVALAMSLALGGGTLPLLLRHVAVSGTAGLACLVSVLVGHPLLALARPLLRRFARPDPPTAQPVRPPMDQRRSFSVLTAIVGVVLLAHAGANVALALTLSTGRYLVVSSVVGWAVTGLGAVVVVGYLKRTRRA